MEKTSCPCCKSCHMIAQTRCQVWKVAINVNSTEYFNLHGHVASLFKCKPSHDRWWLCKIIIFLFVDLYLDRPVGKTVML